MSGLYIKVNNNVALYIYTTTSLVPTSKSNNCTMAILITGNSTNGAKFSLNSEYMLKFTGIEYSLNWATDIWQA